MSRFAAKHSSDIDPSLKDDSYQHGFSYSTDQYTHILKPGLNEGVVREISALKNEPEWMLKLRLDALAQFQSKPTPIWGGDLSEINYDAIRYYLRPTDHQEKTWADVPKEIQETFNRIGVPEAEKNFLAGVKMQYDCLTSDARVFMENGVKAIIDIKAGDFVYSLNEESGLLEIQKVLGLAEKGNRKVFRVITQGGREIKVTANHPFWHLSYKKEEGKVRGRYQKKWSYLSDLKVGDLVAITKDIPEAGVPYKLPKFLKPDTKISTHNQYGNHELDISNWYSKIFTPEYTDDDIMWLFGFYIGDGYFVSKNNNGQARGVDLAIPDSEVQLRNETAKVVKKLFGYDLLVSQKFKVSLNSILFAAFFEELGFSGNAHTKRIPNWVFSLPRSQKRAFIAGYFDADGGIRKTHRSLVMTSVSAKLLEDLQMLILSCGLHTSHVWKFESNYTYKNETRKNSGYRLNITGDLSKILSRMDRKKARFRDSKFTRTFSTASGTVFRKHVSDHIGFAKILAIEELGEEPVYDIEVEGYHNFVANGLIVHNSEVVYGSLKNIWAKDGVIFLSMDEGLAQYPELIKEYFGKLIPSGDNKFSALNTAVWSGGSFVYVPKGVEVKMPLQTYFRINAPNAGQFERTLIIVDEGAKVHYVEGCFLKGTSIVTSDGPVNIEDIEVGDKVMTHTGKYKIVYHTQVRPYTGKIYDLKMRGNPSERTFVTEEHPYLIVKRQHANERNTHWEPAWTPIKEVKVGDYACSPIPVSVKFDSENADGFADEKYLYVPIAEINVQDVTDKPVYNFSVEGDESYVAGGVAVHNCTAPSFSSSSLHSAVVEIFVKKGARCQYTTVQNWYKNIYNLVTKRAHVGEEAEAVWTDFNMGCLTANARVFIEGKGAISIKKVEVGDSICSVDLNTLKTIKAKVTATKDNGIKKVFALKTENARQIEATENHPFLTLTKSSRSDGFSALSWKQLKEIKIDDYVGIIKGLNWDGKPRNFNFTFETRKRTNKLKKEPTVPVESSQDLMWLLGLYIGDGCSERDKDGRCRVSFAVPPADRARVDLEKNIKKLFNLEPKFKGISVTINSVIISEFIHFLGFDGTAKQKRVPSWIFDLPLDQKMAFIEGYLDADGSIVHQKEKEGITYGQIVFASANKDLLEDMKLLMISVGLNPLNISTYSKFRSLYKGEWKNYTCHFLTLNIRDNLKRIREKKFERSNIEFVRVWDIEEIGDEEVYDLEIEGVENFVANGLVVHNSRLTMKYPGFILAGKGARGETLSMALAGSGQHQDTGSKAIHLAPYTSSTIISKSISKNGGRTSYRGLVQVAPQAHHSKNTVICDALLLDPESRSDTYPIDRILNSQVQIQHEATVSKIGEEQLFYLMSRGLTEEMARKMIVNGFIDDLIKKLPMEYAVEMNRLIDHEMEGSIG